MCKATIGYHAHIENYLLYSLRGTILCPLPMCDIIWPPAPLKICYLARNQKELHEPALLEAQQALYIDMWKVRLFYQMEPYPTSHLVHAIIMHPVHNFYHIKSFVKQYISLRRITIHSVSVNTFCRIVCVVVSAVFLYAYCIGLLAGVLLRISLEVSLPPDLPSSHAPPLLLTIAPVLPPSSARSLPPPLFPSLRPCLRSFLTRSLPQPFLPSSTPAPTLPHIIAADTYCILTANPIIILWWHLPFDYLQNHKYTHARTHAHTHAHIHIQ